MKNYFVYLITIILEIYVWFFNLTSNPFLKFTEIVKLIQANKQESYVKY